MLPSTGEPYYSGTAGMLCVGNRQHRANHLMIYYLGREGARMRILIAEDSLVDRRLLEHTIERLGHDCLLAADGLEAWDLYESEGADVIVSDWMMPRLDGLELCRRVRAQPTTPYTYFVFLTLLTDREHVLAGMEAGADDYLVKPLDHYELRMRLIAAARVTDLHRRLRESEHRRGRLEGVQLAARTIEHELRNALTRTAGCSQLLVNRAALPPELHQVALNALS